MVKIRAILLLAAATLSLPTYLHAQDNQPTVSFDEVSKNLSGVFPIRINRFDQVVQNSYNWSNPLDCSLSCELGFTPEAVVIKGRIYDDQPLVQPLENPSMPEWWRIIYGADGLELSFDDPTSATNKLHLVLNFSSAGVRPTVQLLASPSGSARETITGADFRILELPADGITTTTDGAVAPGFDFEAAIPTAGLVEPRFFSGALRVSVRLHDLDGDYRTYLMMQDVIEKQE